MWGHQNHTVLELFMLLSRMHHYQAMSKIKKFVDPDYHRLIKEGEQNPDVLLGQLLKLNDEDYEQSKKKEEKILNVPAAGVAAAAAAVPVVSREDNESVGAVEKPKSKSPSVSSVIFYLSPVLIRLCCSCYVSASSPFRKYPVWRNRRAQYHTSLTRNCKSRRTIGIHRRCWVRAVSGPCSRASGSARRSPSNA